MTLPIVIRREAEAEFQDACDWYERQRTGLGIAFAQAIHLKLSGLANHPFMHPITLADIRKAIVRRFPYTIYYRVHSDRIEVLAIFHAKRDPSDWQRRV